MIARHKQTAGWLVLTLVAAAALGWHMRGWRDPSADVVQHTAALVAPADAAYEVVTVDTPCDDEGVLLSATLAALSPLPSPYARKDEIREARAWLVTRRAWLAEQHGLLPCVVESYEGWFDHVQRKVDEAVKRVGDKDAAKRLNLPRYPR